jgi:hypothetical protein
MILCLEIDHLKGTGNPVVPHLIKVSPKTDKSKIVPILCPRGQTDNKPIPILANLIFAINLLI